jgi:hypothetical protein
MELVIAAGRQKMKHGGQARNGLTHRSPFLRTKMGSLAKRYAQAKVLFMRCFAAHLVNPESDVPGNHTNNRWATQQDGE